MDAVAHGLVAHELCVVRFDFPYMHRRVQAGRRTAAPDRADVLLAAFRAILAAVRGWRRPTPPLVLGGKSMGGRIASMLLANEPVPDVCAAFYLGYPLSPAGRPAKVRADHLPAVPVPQLFVSGSRDSLCDLDLLRPIVSSLSRARLHVVERGDHSLATSRKDPVAGSEVWIGVVADFIREATAQRRSQ
jgi:predicted alpha/beta-hydrolase family hydrolase